MARVVRTRDRSAVLRGLRLVYDASSRIAAARAFGRWTAVYPQAVQRVDKDLDLLLAVYTLPPEHRKMFRTRNGIEPRFRDVRRRTDAIGTFVDDASMERLLFSLSGYFKRKHAHKVCRKFGQSRKVA